MVAIAILSAAAVGAALRWGLQTAFAAMMFPAATLIVNAMGGFLMGFLQAQTHLSPNVKVVLGVGFLGALTTFSAYSWETFKLLQSGQFGWAMLNVVGNNVLALGLCGLGYFWGRLLH